MAIYSITNGGTSDLSGTLRTPNYPSDYPNGQDVYFVISNSIASGISISLQDFESEYCCDFLQIYNGPNSSYSLSHNFQGSTSLPFNSNLGNDFGAWTFRWRADGSVSRRGFTLNWELKVKTIYTQSDIVISKQFNGNQLQLTDSTPISKSGVIYEYLTNRRWFIENNFVGSGISVFYTFSDFMKVTARLELDTSHISNFHKKTEYAIYEPAESDLILNESGRLTSETDQNRNHRYGSLIKDNNNRLIVFYDKYFYSGRDSGGFVSSPSGLTITVGSGIGNINSTPVSWSTQNIQVEPNIVQLAYVTSDNVVGVTSQYTNTFKKNVVSLSWIYPGSNSISKIHNLPTSGNYIYAKRQRPDPIGSGFYWDDYEDLLNTGTKPHAIYNKDLNRIFLTYQKNGNFECRVIDVGQDNLSWNFILDYDVNNNNQYPDLLNRSIAILPKNSSGQKMNNSLHSFIEQIINTCNDNITIPNISANNKMSYINYDWTIDNSKAVYYKDGISYIIMPYFVNRGDKYRYISNYNLFSFNDNRYTLVEKVNYDQFVYNEFHPTGVYNGNVVYIGIEGNDIYGYPFDFFNQYWGQYVVQDNTQNITNYSGNLAYTQLDNRMLGKISSNDKLIANTHSFIEQLVSSNVDTTILSNIGTHGRMTGVIL